MKWKWLSALGVVAVAATFLSVWVGRDYEVPDKVCGVPVEQKALAALLPKGKEIREISSGSATAPHGCRILVDGKTVVTQFHGAVDRVHDPITENQTNKGTHRTYMSDLPFPGKGAVGDDNTVAMTPCRSAATEYLNVELGVDDSLNPDVKQRRSNLERFTKAYVPELKKHLKCTA